MSSREEKRAAKQARRKFRNEIMHRMRRIAIRRIGLVATNAQIEAAARTLTDRYMHKVDHAPLEETTLDPIVIPPRAAETING